MMLGSACKVTGRLPGLRDVWELCRLVGMSPSIIGRTFDAIPGWEKRAMSNATVPVDDQERIALVRALLQRPDVLVLFRVGGGWSLAHQRQLVHVLRGFLDGSLQTHTHRHAQLNASKGSRQTRPSVLFVASDMTLAHLLGADDVVLSLESCASGTLRTYGDAFPDPKKVLDAWMGDPNAVVSRAAPAFSDLDDVSPPSASPPMPRPTAMRAPPSAAAPPPAASWRAHPQTDTADGDEDGALDDLVTELVASEL